MRLSLVINSLLLKRKKKKKEWAGNKNQMASPRLYKPNVTVWGAPSPIEVSPERMLTSWAVCTSQGEVFFSNTSKTTARKQRQTSTPTLKALEGDQQICFGGNSRILFVKLVLKCMFSPFQIKTFCFSQRTWHCAQNKVVGTWATAAHDRAGKPPNNVEQRMWPQFFLAIIFLSNPRTPGILSSLFHDKRQSWKQREAVCQAGRMDLEPMDANVSKRLHCRDLSRACFYWSIDRRNTMLAKTGWAMSRLQQGGEKASNVQGVLCRRHVSAPLFCVLYTECMLFKALCRSFWDKCERQTMPSGNGATLKRPKKRPLVCSLSSNTQV